MNLNNEFILNKYNYIIRQVYLIYLMCLGFKENFKNTVNLVCLSDAINVFKAVLLYLFITSNYSFKKLYSCQNTNLF